ncbi:MAG: HAMP domain-containing protein [Oligoflexales bacterium]|nr:HAMP domain-containing protein [Oligoflexales bacterium]
MLFDNVPIRIRLSFGYAVWMGIIFITLRISILSMVEDNVFRSIDESLTATAKIIEEAHIYQQKSDIIKEKVSWESVLENLYLKRQLSEKYNAQMIDISDKIRARTEDIKSSFPVTSDAIARAKHGLSTFETFRQETDDPVRQLTFPILHSSRFAGELIQVSLSLKSALNELNNIKKKLSISLSLGFFISVIFGYFFAGWAIKPVGRITQAAARLGPNDLHLRLKLPAANDELRDLVKTFNEMLSRIEDSFQRLHRFPGDVSHELRTPLAVMKGEAELALRRKRSEEEYRKSLEIIVKEAENMVAIVEDLLLLARAKGRAFELKLEKVDLSSFLIELESSVKPIFEEKRLMLVTKNSVKSQILLSRGFFLLVMKNLLLNACKYSATESKVELEIVAGAGGTEFLVRDFGEGIPKEYQKYIFDTFYRVDSARNRSKGGVGIGLSLAYALVKMHRGDLTVKSDTGKGAEFKIFIPHSPALQRNESDSKYEYYV